MGIRINKVLGWGFKYCDFERDPRFRKEFWDSRNLYDRDIKTELINEANRLGEELNYFERDWFNKKEYISIGDFLFFGHYEREIPKPTALVFSSEYYKEWYRHDNCLDYYETPSMNEKVKFIRDQANQSCCVYPYYGFVNRKTGERFKVEQSDRWSLTEWYLKMGKDQRLKFEQKVFKKKGVSFIEWQRDIVPQIPLLLRCFLKIAKPFKDDIIMYRLRPMISTYWS